MRAIVVQRIAAFLVPRARAPRPRHATRARNIHAALHSRGGMHRAHRQRTFLFLAPFFLRYCCMAPSRAAFCSLRRVFVWRLVRQTSVRHTCPAHVYIALVEPTPPPPFSLIYRRGRLRRPMQKKQNMKKNPRLPIELVVLSKSPWHVVFYSASSCRKGFSVEPLTDIEPGTKHCYFGSIQAILTGTSKKCFFAYTRNNRHKRTKQAQICPQDTLPGHVFCLTRPRQMWLSPPPPRRCETCSFDSQTQEI
jgi:hypothetical protein